MDEKDYIEFGCIAQQCESGTFRSINVASLVRSNAIVAAWYELKELRRRVAELEELLNDEIESQEAYAEAVYDDVDGE